ncbi:MAG: hypothetical protein M5U31_15475 [Acidimicrobiia bacterium]|nr:hypothetical protein [Acidimicrobiia bacterium]
MVALISPLRLRLPLVLTAVLALAIPVVWATPAFATDFSVPSTNKADEAPGAGSCPGDVCTSLRAAVEAANANAGPDVIDLAMADIGAPFTLDGANGPLVVTEDLAINGIDTDPTNGVVNGQGQTRVFEIRSGTVGFTNLAVVAGQLVATGGPEDGAGILNQGDLRLTNVVVGGNVLDTDAGTNGVRGAGIANLGTLTLNQSNITNNTMRGGGDELGAGVYNGDGATMTATASRLEENNSDERGGGFDNDGGTVTLIDTDIENNVASTEGGGFRNNGGIASMTGGSITGNIAGHGGGLMNDSGGTVTLSDVEISGNSANASGDPFDASGGGVLNTGGGTLAATGSDISSNSAGLGGGVANLGGSATLTSVALDGNTAAAAGGVVNGAGTVEVIDSEVTANISDGDAGGLVVAAVAGAAKLVVERTMVSGNSAAGLGGGLAAIDGGAATILAATIVDNTPTDCATDNGTITDGGDSKDSDGTCVETNEGGGGGGGGGENGGTGDTTANGGVGPADTSDPATLPATGTSMPLKVTGLALIVVGGLLLALGRRHGALT